MGQGLLFLVGFDVLRLRFLGLKRAEFLLSYVASFKTAWLTFFIPSCLLTLSQPASYFFTLLEGGAKSMEAAPLLH